MSLVGNPGWAGSGDVPQLTTLYELLAALSRAKGLEDVYEAAITGLLAATSADRAAILLFDDDGVIRFKAWRGLSVEYRDAVLGHTPWSKGTRDAQPIVIADVLNDESLTAYHDVFAREGIRALGFVPLALEGGVFGKFMLYYAMPHECTPDELGIAQAIATHVALATEHKRVELACARSEQRLQAILDNSTAVIFLKDVNGRYQLINNRYEELFHVSKKDVVGRTDHDIFPSHVADRFRENDRLVLAAGTPLSLEEEAPHDDGIHTYISLKFPLQNPDGDAPGVCGIATDITDRKRLETAALQLAAIVESSDDAIIGKDLNGIIVSWNKGAERIFGYTAAEAIGNPVSLLAAPERLNEMPDILSKIRNGERIEHYETRRRRKNGETIDVSLTVSPIRDASNRIIGASKIARDITDRKRAEKEYALLLAREHEARQTAELLNRVGPRLAAQLDLETLVQEVTDIATALVGAEFGAFFHNVQNHQEGESSRLYAVSGVPRETFAGFPMPGNTSVLGPTFRGEGIVRSDDITMDPRYGQNSPFQPGDLPVRSYLAAPVLSRTGEVLGGLFFGHSTPGKFGQNQETILLGIASQAGIAMDNARFFQQTEWVQTELKRSNEELRRANQDLETFAYSASHDLQEPLRTIALSAQLLERRIGKKLDPEDANLLPAIGSAAVRMATLIQDLLAYTRATKYPEGPAPRVDSAVVLATTLESLAGLIDQARAKVTWEKMPVISIHETRLAQLFQNLISNAIKYRGNEDPRVHISGDERDGWCVFSVVDNGIGIESKFENQIFEIFKRLHGRDQYPGSGIGLSICQRIVEQYGGRIWVDKSAPGEGATFCFAIPSTTR